jgi:hypothetical protein
LLRTRDPSKLYLSNARQVAHIDTAENKSLYLRCGDHAERLAIVDIAEFISVGMTK